jgi:hypothetical protein
VIDLNDLASDEIVEHYKYAYGRVGHNTPFVTVNYVIRDEPGNYTVVPAIDAMKDASEAVLRQQGLLIDTRHIRRVCRLGSGVLRIQEELYEDILSNQQAFKGNRLQKEYLAVGNILRPNHTYVNINFLSTFIRMKVLHWFPRPRAYLDAHTVQQKLIASKTLHHVAKPISLILRDSLYENFEEDHVIKPHLFLDINLTKLYAWLKRNQSKFYVSSEATQSVIDQYDAEALQRETKEAFEAQQKMLEDDSVEVDDLGDDAIFEEDPDAPELTFLPSSNREG